METIDVINAISTVGFPVVACYFLFRQNTKFQDIVSQLSGTLISLSKTLEEINRRIESIERQVFKDGFSDTCE